MRRINHPKLNSFGFAALLALAATLVPAPAQAITRTVTLTATPAVIDTGAKPGKETKVSFRLKNSADVVLPIQMSTRNTQIKEGQTAEEVSAMSARSWISFTQPDFVLKANETKTVSAVLSVPKDASPGGHYADLVVRPLSLEGSEDIVAAQPELVVQMLVTVPGDIKQDLQASLKSPATIVTARTAQEKLVFSVTNHGNIHTLFQPRLYLWKGEEALGTVELPPVIVLPKENRQVEFSPPPALSAGTYRLQMKLSYGTPTKETTSHYVRMVVLPFHPLFLLLIPALAAIAYGIRHRHRVLTAVKIITRGE